MANISYTFSHKKFDMRNPDGYNGIHDKIIQT
jgi:hypothetical protein